jgi:transcriptional regulator with XRE-family HTH domain
VPFQRTLLNRAIGLRLSQYRREKKMSQAKLGEWLNLSRTSITNIERGHQAIQFDQLYQAALILGVEPHVFLPSIVEMQGRFAPDENGRSQYLAVLRGFLSGSDMATTISKQRNTESGR